MDWVKPIRSHLFTTKVEITDNHFHLDPQGRKDLAVKDFLNAGGTRLVIVNKPYTPWKKMDKFKEQVNTTLNLANKARDVGAKVAVVASPHPIDLVKMPLISSASLISSSLTALIAEESLNIK